ncbi:MAG TPA: sigma-70 family RNA polymerase sigma factor [Solirubrobacteraceae bacterium]|nr:sigma-70 family RNA polymerase sigma factor [Solirubrobacteraceae bacterium]
MAAVAQSAALPTQSDYSSDCPDGLLVARTRAGDDRAFEQLYRRYRRRISAHVYGMVGDHGRAEDITQEVFVSALRRIRATERPIAFSPWAHEIARNACIDEYRRNQRSAQEVSYDADDAYGQRPMLDRLPMRDSSPEDALETKQRVVDLCGAFSGLSPAHHRILVLREFEGLSYREIGERMEMSRPAVESTLLRARRRLAAEYDELVSGRRCERVQRIISDSLASDLGVRDRQRLARHISHCQPCRALARAAALPDAAACSGVREKLAALIPLPFLPGAWRHGGGAISAGRPFEQLATQAATGGWERAAAAVATLAIASLGAGTALQPSGPGRTSSRAPAGKPAQIQGIGSAAARADRPGVADPRRPSSGGTAAVSGRDRGGSTTLPGAGGAAPPSVRPGSVPADPTGAARTTTGADRAAASRPTNGSAPPAKPMSPCGASCVPSAPPRLDPPSPRLSAPPPPPPPPPQPRSPSVAGPPSVPSAPRAPSLPTPGASGNTAHDAPGSSPLGP